jgi:hypothetical protein
MVTVQRDAARFILDGKIYGERKKSCHYPNGLEGLEVHCSGARSPERAIQMPLCTPAGSKAFKQMLIARWLPSTADGLACKQSWAPSNTYDSRRLLACRSFVEMTKR